MNIKKWVETTTGTTIEINPDTITTTDTAVYGEVKRNRKPLDRREYEEELARKQREHLDSLENSNWQPCMHDNCPECVGTGIKKNGGTCIHMISCPCPKCTPRF